MSAPLAQRIRPQTIDDIVGQRHLLGEGKPLRNIILSGELPNMVFYVRPESAKRRSRALSQRRPTAISSN